MKFPWRVSAAHNSPPERTEPFGFRSVLTVADERRRGRLGRRFRLLTVRNSLTRFQYAKLVPAHRHLPLQRDRFLVVGINGDRAEGVLPRFAAVAAVEEDLAEQNVCVY